MKRIRYENEKLIKNDARVQVVELLKKHGIDEVENKCTPTDDKHFIDGLVNNLFLCAYGYSNGWTIPEDWQMDPTVTENLKRDVLDQRVDTALINTVRNISFVDMKAAVDLQRGDLHSASKQFGVSPYVVAPRLVLAKEREYVDSYAELRIIFLSVLGKINELSEE